MTLGWILWFATLLPQPAADSLCLGTTVYLEARNQSVLGQQAVAEVALRRQDSGLWGDSMCEVVTARKQFAPGIVAPRMRLSNSRAWVHSLKLAASKLKHSKKTVSSISLKMLLAGKSGSSFSSKNIK